MELGDLIVSIRLRTEALEKGLEQTRRQLREQERATKEAAATQRELQDAYTATAAVATVAFAGITAAILGGVSAYNEYTSVMKGFENQVKSTGQSVTQARDVMSQLSEDGLISESDTAAAIKNLLNYGFSIERAKQTLQALKDTAVDNRQAHYTLGEAVRVTTEGIRNENSVLADAAGVQKNIAKMLEDYAKALGKKTDDLTKAEKAEAVYQGVMAESAANMGRASEYARELGGQQAQLAASTLQLSQAFGASMAPSVSGVLAVFQPLLDFVVDAITRYPELAAALTAAAAAISGLVAAIGAVVAAKIAWAAATKAMGVALSTLMLHPVVIGLTAIAAILAVVAVRTSEARKEKELLAQAEKEYNDVIHNGIQQNEVAAYEEKIEVLKKLKVEYDEAVEKAKELNAAFELELNTDPNSKKLAVLKEEFDENKRVMEEASKSMLEYGSSVQTVERDVEAYTKAVNKAKVGTFEQVQEQARQVAMTHREALVIEDLLKTYSVAEKGSSEWNKAQKELAQMFPQFSTAVGVNEEAIRGLLIVKQQETAAAWASVQAKAQEIVMEKRRELSVREAAIAAVEAGAKWLFGMDNAANATRVARQEVERLKGEIVSLEELAKIDPSKVAGVAPVVETVVKAPNAYENKALDEAYRLMEHRKRMNQLSLEDEIQTLESIKANHIRTAQERMEIEERLFDAKSRFADTELDRALARMDKEKALGLMDENAEIVRLQRIKKLYADTAEERQQLDDMIFDATLRKREAQKDYEAQVLAETTRLYADAAEDRLLRENLSAQERYELERKTYDAIIVENQRYLDAVLADSKYTEAEKVAIEKRVTADIRANVNERLQLERDYNEQVRQESVASINRLSDGIQTALRQKYQAEKLAEEQRIRGLLDSTEEWRRSTLAVIKTAYDERVRAAEDAANREMAVIDAKYNAQIAAIQGELAALEEAEKQKTRSELDAESDKRISRLQGLIAYEHDEFNKVQLQKELNKELADRDKRHQQEQLQDKKDALKAEERTLRDKLRAELDQVKAHLAEQKIALNAARDAELGRIEQIADAQRNSLNAQLTATQNHYARLLESRVLQAEAEKLIIGNQQNEIIKLLESFGEGYALTGQTLGEKMYTGFKSKVDQIGMLIGNINAQIDAARNAALNLAASQTATASAAASSSKTKATSNTVTINNTFTAPVTSPSDVTKATQKTAQKLALGL